jgi:hypothetical protein
MFIAATERAATAITDLDFYHWWEAAIKPVAVRTTPPSPGEVFDGASPPRQLSVPVFFAAATRR